MFVCKKEFLTGLLIATISVSAATNISSLYAVERKYSPEVEFSQRIGLFDSELLSEKTLRSNIAEIAFYRGLNLILVDKGIVGSYNTNNLESLGITQTQSPMGSITRQKAAETIMRSLIHAQNQSMISVSNGKKIHFKDYVPVEKYEDMLSFAIENKLFKGTGRNMFKPSKKLTVREALAFLKNLYELEVTKVSKDTTVSNGISNEISNEAANTGIKPADEPVKGKIKTFYIEPDVTKFFKDVTPENPIVPTMKKLINAGALTYTNLNNELCLPKSITNNDFALICKGMVTKAGRPEFIENIDSILGSVDPNAALTRETAVKYGAILVDVYHHKDYNIKVNYTDVAEGSPTDDALKKVAKAGIKMGYNDGSLKGHEKISRYEALNLLGIIVGDNVDTKVKIETFEETPSAPATKPVVKQTAPKEDVQPCDKPEIKPSEKVENREVVKPSENKTSYKGSEQAQKLEQQLKDKYNGLTFQERIELRKKELRRILNK